MIQMRENRYDDIRSGIVNRSGETTYNGFSTDSKNQQRTSATEQSDKPDPRANQADEYLDDEYNSWS